MKQNWFGPFLSSTKPSPPNHQARINVAADYPARSEESFQNRSSLQTHDGLFWLGEAASTMNMGRLPDRCCRPASAEACHFGPRHTSCTHSGEAVRASAGSWTTSAAPTLSCFPSVPLEGNCLRNRAVHAQCHEVLKKGQCPRLDARTSGR